MNLRDVRAFAEACERQRWLVIERQALPAEEDAATIVDLYRVIHEGLAADPPNIYPAMELVRRLRSVMIPAQWDKDLRDLKRGLAGAIQVYAREIVRAFYAEVIAPEPVVPGVTA